MRVRLKKTAERRVLAMRHSIRYKLSAEFRKEKALKMLCMLFFILFCAGCHHNVAKLSVPEPESRFSLRNGISFGFDPNEISREKLSFKIYIEEGRIIYNIEVLDCESLNPLQLTGFRKGRKEYIYTLKIPVPTNASANDEKTTVGKNIVAQIHTDKGEEEVELQVCLQQKKLDVVIKREFRRDFVGWTYPIWGLPRDLIDVPFTWLNHLGYGNYGIINLGAQIKSKSEVEDYELGESKYSEPRDKFADIRSVTAIMVGYFKGWYVSGFPVTFRNLYSLKPFLYGIAYGAMGLLLAVESEDVYGFAINPLQTILLRSGADKKLLKDLDDLEFRKDEEETKRSFAFFPNWKYIAKRPITSTEIAWRIVDIKKR